MDCRKIQTLFTEYIDAAINSKNRLIVDEHLKTCEECAREMDAFRKAKTLLGGLEHARLPAGFLGELEERLNFQKAENTFHYKISRAVYIFRSLLHSACKGFILHPVKYTFSLAAAAALLLVLLNTLILQKTKIPLGNLLMAHNETLKGSDMTNREVSRYIASNINLDQNDVVMVNK